jgi:hypothetical protein
MQCSKCLGWSSGEAQVQAASDCAGTIGGKARSDRARDCQRCRGTLDQKHGDDAQEPQSGLVASLSFGNTPIANRRRAQRKGHIRFCHTASRERRGTPSTVSHSSTLKILPEIFPGKSRFGRLPGCVLCMRTPRDQYRRPALPTRAWNAHSRKTLIDGRGRLSIACIL